MRAWESKFGLRQAFAALTGAAVVSAVLAQVPRDVLWQAVKTTPTLVVGSTVMALVPLVLINLVCTALSSAASPAADRRLRWSRPDKLLGAALGAAAPSWRLAALIAVSSTLITALVWGLLREVGLAAAVGASQGLSRGWSVLDVDLMTDLPFHARMFRWELFAIARWWLLFTALALTWMVAAAPLRRRRPMESASACARRLLAFGPWIVLLEVSFLVGVWTWSAMVVPEPSTGFVEGIFSWEKWHWDCWRGRVWINRGLVPTFVAATVFFRYALRWRWLAAVCAGAWVIPPALMLSVAWTVLHSHPEPWLRATAYFWRALS